MKNEHNVTATATTPSAPLRIKTNVRAGLRWYAFLIPRARDLPQEPNAVSGVRG